MKLGRKKQLSKGRKWKSGVESSERKRERERKSCLPSQLLVLRGKRSNGVTEEGEEWPPKRGEKKGRRNDRKRRKNDKKGRKKNRKRRR